MTSSSPQPWRSRGPAVAALLATLCVATAPIGGARADNTSLDLDDSGIEFRVTDTGLGVASFNPGDLGSLLRRGGAPAGGLSLAAFAPPAPPTLASRGDAPTAVAVPPPLVLGPIVSGLAWRSGASCGSPEFEAWRGRRMDVTAIGIRQRSFELMAASLQDPVFRARVASTPQPVVNIPLLPKTEFKQHAACAAGRFDAPFRQLGGLLVQAGAGNAILRVGWEANIGSGSHAWGIDTAAEIPNYVRCFRRVAAQLKLTAPRVKIEWTNAKASNLPVSVLAANPGDDVTDLWGLHYYDVNGQFRTQALWDAFYQSTRFGGPQGIGRWLAEARAHGKRLGVPEWGVWNRSVAAAAADDPVYIQNMFRTFLTNATTIAYDNYYNCPTAHRLHPDTLFPRSSALYRQLWTRGR